MLNQDSAAIVRLLNSCAIVVSDTTFSGRCGDSVLS